MSEPSQLIARIPMTPEAYGRYLEHQVEPASGFPAIGAWLAGKRWHGEVTTAQLVASAQSGMPVRDWIAGFTSGGPYAPAPHWTLERYDHATATWTFAAYDFSENYGDYVTALNVLGQAAAYQKTGETGYIAIVPYAFGSGFDYAEALIEIRDGKARFIDQAPPEFIAYALRTFDGIEQAVQALEDPGG